MRIDNEEICMGRANEEIKKYLQDFVPKALEGNEVFIKVFGRGYAKRRLFLNLNKVYTADYMMRNLGEYDLSDKCITLYNKEKHLTLKDIEDNPVVAVHECVHAILNRTRLECRLFGIEIGTGIQEEKKRGNEVYELGRGANEGLTNWICKKSRIFS